MTHTQHTAIVIPLAVGAIAFAGTIVVHTLFLTAVLHFIRRERRLGRAGTTFGIDVAIVTLVMSGALVAHLIEIALWAVLFMMCGEFSQFGTAYYHSAVNYTTLGYGDMIMTPAWRLLGPLEGAIGALMFGVTTATIFAVIQLLIRSRFVDLKD